MKNLRSSASLCNAARRVCGAALLAISAFTCEVCLGAVCTALALSGQRFKAGYKLPINANKAASLVLARMGSMESKGFMLKKSSGLRRTEEVRRARRRSGVCVAMRHLSRDELQRSTFIFRFKKNDSAHSMQTLMDADSDDEEVGLEFSNDPTACFVKEVCRFINVAPSSLLDGDDNRSRDRVRWVKGEMRMYRWNPLRLNETFAKARDRAHLKLVRTGFARTDMDAMLSRPEVKTIFARLTATFYAFQIQMNELHLDLEAYYTRHPEMRRVEPYRCASPPRTRGVSTIAPRFRASLEASTQRFLTQ